MGINQVQGGATNAVPEWTKETIFTSHPDYKTPVLRTTEQVS